MVAIRTHRTTKITSERTMNLHLKLTILKVFRLTVHSVFIERTEQIRTNNFVVISAIMQCYKQKKLNALILHFAIYQLKNSKQYYNCIVVGGII